MPVSWIIIRYSRSISLRKYEARLTTPLLRVRSIATSASNCASVSSDIESGRFLTVPPPIGGRPTRAIFHSYPADRSGPRNTIPSEYPEPAQSDLENAPCYEFMKEALEASARRSTPIPLRHGVHTDVESPDADPALSAARNSALSYRVLLDNGNRYAIDHALTQELVQAPFNAERR